NYDGTTAASHNAKPVSEVIPFQFYDVQVDSGSTIASGDSSNVVDVSHNWTNNSNVLMLTRLGVVFNGTGPQLITGGADSSFGDIAISNTGSTVTIFSGSTESASDSVTVLKGT